MQQCPDTSGFVLCVGLPLVQVAEVARLLRDESVVLATADADGALALLRLVGPVGQAAQAGPAGRLTGRSDNGGRSRVLQIASLRVDLAGREVRVAGSRVHLSTREFDLLAALAAEIGRVRSFEELTVQVWRTGYLGDPDPVVSAVKRLRKRLAAVAGVEIASVRGIGYRLLVSTPPAGADEDADRELAELRVLPLQSTG